MCKTVLGAVQTLCLKLCIDFCVNSYVWMICNAILEQECTCKLVTVLMKIVLISH